MLGKQKENRIVKQEKYSVWSKEGTFQHLVAYSNVNDVIRAHSTHNYPANAIKTKSADIGCSDTYFDTNISTKLGNNFQPYRMVQSAPIQSIANLVNMLSLSVLQNTAICLS